MDPKFALLEALNDTMYQAYWLGLHDVRAKLDAAFTSVCEETFGSPEILAPAAATMTPAAPEPEATDRQTWARPELDHPSEAGMGYEAGKNAENILFVNFSEKRKVNSFHR